MSQELPALHDRLDRILKGAAKAKESSKFIELWRGAQDVLGKMLFEHEKTSKEPVTQ